MEMVHVAVAFAPEPLIVDAVQVGAIPLLTVIVQPTVPVGVRVPCPLIVRVNVSVVALGGLGMVRVGLAFARLCEACVGLDASR